MKGKGKQGKRDQGSNSLGIIVLIVDIFEELLNIITAISLVLFKAFFKLLGRKINQKLKREGEL